MRTLCAAALVLTITTMAVLLAVPEGCAFVRAEVTPGRAGLEVEVIARCLSATGELRCRSQWQQIGLDRTGVALTCEPFPEIMDGPY